MQNTSELCDRLSELQSALPLKCLPIPGEKLCVMPLTGAILRSTEHITFRGPVFENVVYC
jgi:hypothetical protein